MLLQAAYTAAACLLLRALPSLPSLWRVKVKLLRPVHTAGLTAPVSQQLVRLMVAALGDAVGRCGALTELHFTVDPGAIRRWKLAESWCNLRAWARGDVSTGYNHVEGDLRASRNGLVTDFRPEAPNVTLRNFCIA